MQWPGVPKTNNPLDRPVSRRHVADVILLTVKGTPRPQPRPRFVRGRVVSTADPNARRWKASVEAVARQAAKEHGQQSGPLSVSLGFEMPTADKKRHGLPHTMRPDSDNLAKLVLDAMMSAGLIGDDSAVSCLIVRKTWSPSPLAGVSLAVAADARVPLPASSTPAWLA